MCYAIFNQSVQGLDVKIFFFFVLEYLLLLLRAMAAENVS